jgi:hypothetical protein
MVENQLKQQVPGFGDSAMQESERNRIQMEETKLRASMEVIDNLFLNAFSFYSSRNMIKNKFD